ncbi:hypothetical protein OG705_04215 [Streptomyces sp. NBC_00838]|uniref:hypothetical protein n=1 Tax=Streptomyces sp. NBC_00838 TaxID=2903680 RepID=UPI003862DC1F|nr:hypothetical protein OG705_04215 [Streptomyces sp. NBC_00838]
MNVAVEDERHLSARHHPLDLVTRGDPQIRRQEIVHHRWLCLDGRGLGDGCLFLPFPFVDYLGVLPPYLGDLTSPTALASEHPLSLDTSRK